MSIKGFYIEGVIEKYDFEHLANKPTVDSALSGSSTNAIQNSAVKTALDNKASLNDIYAAHPHDTVTGSIANFPDGANDLPVKDLSVAIDPVQNLNGYSNPWPAGGGKNKLDTSNTTHNNYNIGSIPNTLLTNTTYTFSVNGTTAYKYKLWLAKAVDPLTAIVNLSGGSNIGAGQSATFTTPADMSEYTSLCIAGASNGAGNESISNILLMVELGSPATSYAPYSNICPITGWTGANVWHTGKNLLRLNFSNSTSNQVTWTNEGNGVVKANGTASAYTEKYIGKLDLKAGVTYHLKGGISGLVNFYLYTTSVLKTDSGNGADYTPTRDIKNVYAYVSVASGVTVNNQLIYPLIEIGTTNVFEPYAGSSVSVSWQTEAGTVYGGTLDVTTGVLTVNKVSKTISTLTNRSENANGYFWHSTATALSIPLIASTNAGLISDRFALSSNTSYTSGEGRITFFDSGIIRWKEQADLTKEQYTNYLAEHPFQIVYQPATTTTYQLTPTEVKTLLGTNNIWADTGNTTVNYCADTTLFVNKVAAAVVNAV